MLTYILNIIDLIFTLYVVRHGAVEVNPFMQNIPFMIFYKVFVIGVLCMLLTYLGCKKSIILCAAAFAAVNMWHIVNIVTSIIL